MDKRRKELARQERQKEKRARKAAGRESEPGANGSAPEDDPDLAGIQLGPQPPQDEAPPQ
jgi:hypothetical protein